MAVGCEVLNDMSDCRISRRRWRRWWRQVLMAVGLLAAVAGKAMGATPTIAKVAEYKAASARMAERRMAMLEVMDGADEAVLAELARDVDMDVAVAAATALGRERDRRTDAAVQALCRLVDDPRSAVRRVAFLSLFNLVLNREGDFDEQYVIPAVLKGMGVRDPGVSQLALKATEYMGDPSVLAELLDMMQDPHTTVGMRLHLAWAVGEQGSAYAVPALLDCLDVEGHFFVYYYAAMSLAKITGADVERPEKVRPHNWERYKRLYGSDEWRHKAREFYKDWWSRYSKDLVVGPVEGEVLADDPAIKQLLEGMKSGDWGERQRSTRELIGRGSSVRPLLERLARAVEPRLALQAQKGLMLLEGKSMARRGYKLQVVRPVAAGPGGGQAKRAVPAKSAAGGPAYATNPFEFELSVHGGLHVVDLDGDGVTEFLVIGRTAEGSDHRPCIAAYSHEGDELWSVRPGDWVRRVPENPVGEFGLMEGGGRSLVYMLVSGVVELRSVVDGRLQKSAGPFKTVDGVEFVQAPGHVHRATIGLADLTGRGRRDVIVAMQRSVLALGADLEPYWNLSVEGPWSHEQLEIFDIDNDGRDEIFLGGTAIGPDGRVLYCMQSGGHMDDCEAADFVPARPGLEVIYAQERGADAVLLCDKKGLIWERVSGEEPQMFVVGDFYPGVPGAEAFCPARGETRPFIISGTGEFVVGFGDATNSGQPSPYPLGWDWHLRGRAEEKTKAHWGHVIGATDFDGDGFDELLVVRDEGTELVKPTTWEVVFRLEGITGQTKLAQVVGDAREELIIIRDDKCYIWTPPPMSPSAGQRLRGAR